MSTLYYDEGDTVNTQRMHIRIHNNEIQSEIDALYVKLKDCDDTVLRDSYVRKIHRLKSKLITVEEV